MRRRPGRRVRTIALAAVALAGCGVGSESVPAACGESPDAFAAALRGAPAPVRVDGTPISRCFARRSGAADIENLGGTLVEVASRLSAQARGHPHAHATTELGYLIGASERGAARTEGIHYELIRRLEMETTGIDTHGAAYRVGHDAGRRSG